MNLDLVHFLGQSEHTGASRAADVQRALGATSHHDRATVGAGQSFGLQCVHGRLMADPANSIADFAGNLTEPLREHVPAIDAFD